MFNIIKTDFYKFFKSKTFYIILGVTLFFAILSVVGNYFALEQLADGESLGPGARVAGDAREILFMGINGIMNIMLIAVMSTIFVAGEYSTGVIKDTVSSGTSRTKIFISKLIVTAFAAIILSLINIITQTAFGSILIGYGQAFDWNEFLLVATTFVSASFIIIAFNTLFVTVTTVLKSLGGALAVNVGVVMFGGLLFSLVALINETVEAFSDYWLMSNLDQVVENALLDTYSFEPLIIAGSYLILSLIIGIKVFKKQDIK